MVRTSSLPGSRTDVTPIDSSWTPGVVVADVHVAVPQARHERLAAAVDDLRAWRHRDGVARADRDDRALVDDDRLVGHELRRVSVEEPHADEGHRALRRVEQRLPQPGRLRGERLRLRVFDLLLLAGIGFRQPGDPEAHAEEMLVRIGPDGQRRGAEAGDAPERDRLRGRAGADLKCGELLGVRLAAGQQRRAFDPDSRGALRSTTR